MLKVLVTGGSSYIGMHCLAQLIEKGYDVKTTVRSNKKADLVKSDLEKHLNKSIEIDVSMADLLKDDGWDDAVKGVDAIFHVAGPYPLNAEGDEQDHIKPHVEGTLRVLNAAKKHSINRVILTSSAATVWMGVPGDEDLDETKWTDVNRENVPPYQKGKTLGEKAAWDFAKLNKEIQLTSILPQLVFGPGIGDHLDATSMKMFNMIAKKEMPVAPKMKAGLVDVRDVAKMHIAALENDESVGRRFIVCSQPYWFKEIGQKFIDLGYKGPTFEPPNFLIKLLSNVDKTLKNILPVLGLDFRFDLEPSKKILGYKPIPLDKTISDQGEYLRSLE